MFQTIFIFDVKKLLPQANTLATVIRTFKLIANIPDCTLDQIASFNKFEKRQASYYANACFFLDLINEDLSLTPVGVDIMSDPKNAKVRIYELIIEHELTGILFSKTALYSKETAIKEGKKIVKSIYPEYGDAVIDRRTRCIIGWCEEIIDFIKKSK